MGFFVQWVIDKKGFKFFIGMLDSKENESFWLFLAQTVKLTSLLTLDIEKGNFLTKMVFKMIDVFWLVDVFGVV